MECVIYDEGNGYITPIKAPPVVKIFPGMEKLD
jgi:hypothetical protein